MKWLPVLALAIVLAVAGDADACSCVPGTLEEEILRADAIFVGKVVRLEVTKVDEHGISTIEASIDVVRRYKGTVPNIVVITTSDGCCYCAPWFEISRTYLIFADEEQGRFTTSTCTRTKLLSAADEELKLLEKPRK